MMFVIDKTNIMIKLIRTLPEDNIMHNTQCLYALDQKWFYF